MVQKKIQHANDLVRKIYKCVVCGEQHEKVFRKADKPPITEAEYCYGCKSERFFSMKN